MIIALALAAAVVASSAAHGAPTRFDLICTGSSMSNVDGVRTEGSLALELRIDLDQRLYCMNDCGATIRINDVLPDAIVLTDTNDAQPGDWTSTYRHVSRVTGDYLGAHIERGPVSATYNDKGRCEVAPFKGFPAAKF